MKTIDRVRRHALQSAIQEDLKDRYTWWDASSSPATVASTLLQENVFKKYAPGGRASSQAVNAGIEKFLDVNSWPDFSPQAEGDSEVMSRLLDLFKEEMSRLFDHESVDVSSPTFDDLADRWVSGPGSSVKSDSRNFYTKFFESDWSYTNPFVLQLFVAMISRSTTWTSAFEHWSKLFKPVHVEGNTLFTVLKNEEITRTCCTEPLLNMCIQQAIGSWMESRLAQRHSIDLARQPDFNRELTRLGSVDGSYGTIDSASASDSISTELVRWSIVNSTLRGLIMATRSELTRLPDGSSIRLRMVSTMGNGFTFPLETAIFSCATRAVYLLKGYTPRAGSPAQGANYGVFGDDIVCKHDCYPAIIALLQRLGFRVNVGKSFNTGPFRESCGFDYFRGTNVRPVFIKTLRQSHDVYSAFNRLSRWSAVHRVPLVRTLQLLYSWARPILIPFSESDDSGFKVPQSVLKGAKLNQFGQVRYNALVPYGVEQPVPFKRSDARKLGYRDFNTYGWELAFIGSYARSKRGEPSTAAASCKPEAVIFRRPFQGEVLPRRLRSRGIPYWDWIGPSDARFPASALHDWQVMLEAILG